MMGRNPLERTLLRTPPPCQPIHDVGAPHKAIYREIGWDEAIYREIARDPAINRPWAPIYDVGALHRSCARAIYREIACEPVVNRLVVRQSDLP